MANTIEYAKVFQQELDKQVIEGCTSGWMEANASQVIYNGGNEIKMPKMSLQGLGSYSRSEGYTDGAVTYSFETYTLSQDRGRRKSAYNFATDGEGGFSPAPDAKDINWLICYAMQ